MPEALSQLVATPGLIWLLITIGCAGIVRGFTGFGTALIFVPVAGIFLEPRDVIAVMVMTGMVSTCALLPKAWGEGLRSEVGILLLVAGIAVPLGLYLLTRLDVTTIRWAVAVFASVTLIAVVTGWRYRGQINRPGLMAVGGGAGLMGGMTGLTGPVVILFYLTGSSGPQMIRANTILFLAGLDLILLIYLSLQGYIDLRLILLAGALSIPYLITSLIGQALFDPALERLYRSLAYAVVAAAVIIGLPIWG